MNYDLRTEGFSLDEDLREELLLRCRKVVLGVEPGCAVEVTIRQVEGRVQARIEISMPGRRVSAVVWRSDPLDAMDSAAGAVLDAVGVPLDGDSRFSEPAYGSSLSTLQ